MSLQNIPQELRELRQWVVANANKQPLNPRNGQAASPIDPSTWGTFAEAMATGYPHVGFVLTKEDPYCIVDLDDPATIKVGGVTMPNPDVAAVQRIGDRHRRILEAFPTYAELSQSGTGVHIICKGSVPHGCRRDKVEVYSDARYMICTGNLVKNLPITEQQTLVTMLFDEMEQGRLQAVELEQVQGHLTDEQVYNMGATAANADKFLRLWQGQWEGHPEWPSQSEADFALLAMLGFYSRDNEQVRRLFRYSALGKREKAVRNDKYLNYALTKIRGKELPLVDLTNLQPAPHTDTLPGYENIASNEPGPITATDTSSGLPLENKTPLAPDTLPTIEPPPGFIGDLAGYFFSSAIRPVREIALCSAIAVTAGTVARAFNISGTGLNQYLIFLGYTGCGKEGLGTGIDSLLNAVRPTCPMIDEIRGPGAFASGQALVRTLDRNPCFVSILGEVGFLIQNICSPNASPAEVMLKKVLLDIYAKSGWGKILPSSVYSDSEKNTKIIQAPNVTILGESTPEIFYSGLDVTAIAQGLVPRFTIFEYTGPRPQSNPNAFHPPDSLIIRQFQALAAAAMTAAQNRVCSPVQMDTNATRLMREFDAYADEQINSSGQEVTRQLWNRAHLKALKMAALIAVGNNPHAPVVDHRTATWAINLVHSDITRLQGKYDQGAIGTGDVRQELDVRQAIKEYLGFSRVKRLSYGCPEKLADFQLIPFGFLRRRLRMLNTFKADKRGSNAALEATLQNMVNAEILVRLPPMQARQYDTNAPVFMTGQGW